MAQVKSTPKQAKINRSKKVDLEKQGTVQTLLSKGEQLVHIIKEYFLKVGMYLNRELTIKYWGVWAIILLVILNLVY